MAKKRSKSSSRKALMSTALDAQQQPDERLLLDTDHDAPSPQTQHVSRKDLADASAEDIARASFDAPAAVLSPRHDEFSDDNGFADASASADGFAASAAETVLSWKLAHNRASVSPPPAPTNNNSSSRHDHAANANSGDNKTHQQPPAPVRSSFAFEQIPDIQHIGSDHENYKSDDDAASMDPLVVPNIKTYDLNSSSSGFLGQYIDEEVHHQTHNYRRGSQPRGSHPSLHGLVHAGSPSSSLIGSSATTAGIPHSKSLILDDQHAPVVLQAIPSSKVEVVEVVAEQSWLVTKLTVQLLWALRMSQRWMLCALRLTWFVILLFPPLIRMTIYFCVDDRIHKNIIFGLNGRNLLDVYTVPDGTPVRKAPLTTSDASADESDSPEVPSPRYPVVVFFTGGAWIIGYKAWGALIGKVLSAFGIVVVTPDYRNFPQGIVPDMVEDATRAMQWVFDNIHLFGGDPENVTVVGQSAGAHIAVCALLELVEKKERALRRHSSNLTNVSASAPVSGRSGLSCAPSPTYSTSSRVSHASSVVSTTESLFVAAPTWELKQVRSFIGISGPYNIEVAVETFHRHGFDKNVVERIMDKKLAYYSPALRLLAKSELPNVARVLEDFPPVYLFHGTSDKTVSWRSTEQFASALEACAVPVKVQYFEGKTHTDPIIEDPILGDDFLLDEIRKIIMECAPRDANGATRYTLGSLSPTKRYYPSLLVKAARRMNPF